MKIKNQDKKENKLKTKNIKETARFMAAVNQGLTEANNGEVFTTKEVRARLRSKKNK